MIAVSPTAEQIDRARKLASDIGVPGKSIRQGRGNWAGCLAEVAVSDLFGWPICSDYEFDVLNRNGHKIDVKTKSRTVDPQPHHVATVSGHRLQNCDRYVFCSTNKRTEKLWIIGGIDAAEFMHRATFHRKGEVDPTGNGQWTFRADCYNLPYSDLVEFGHRQLTVL